MAPLLHIAKNGDVALTSSGLIILLLIIALLTLTAVSLLMIGARYLDDR